jgi:CHASE3 domain sensor protein
MRARALKDLATALAQAQQWEQAQAIIGMIKNSYERARALLNLATALAHAQQWEQAQAIISTIERSSAQVPALRNLVRGMAAAGEDEALLHGIHRWWRLANNKEDALTLFPMVAGIIHRNPELGFALLDAYTWVDTFLKGGMHLP